MISSNLTSLLQTVSLILKEEKVMFRSKLTNWVMLSILSLGLIMLSADAFADILLQDGFEDNEVGDNPDGWIIDGVPEAFEIADDPVHGGKRSLKVISVGLGNYRKLAFEDAPSTDLFTAEFWVYPEGVDKASLGICLNIPAGGNSGPFICPREGGQIAYWSDKYHYVEDVPFDAFEWHHVALVVNVKDFLFD